MQAAHLVQVLTTAIGVGGTLAAALLTQKFNRRTERDRYVREDRSRWLAERQRLGAKFLAGALSLERDLWSSCSHLDSDNREERLPGHRTILLSPEGGIPGVLDSLTRHILIEDIEAAFEKLNNLEELIAEITLIGTPGEAMTASDVHDILGSVVGHLEAFSPFDVAADLIEESRTARDMFAEEARESLRVDGIYVPSDGRPRA
ncbi:hypothetical protein OOK39_12000 [Streptomyces sp. NBC_00264]|uniref:hypothetical protein n=1 Tax=unclassified Streptomyces TaxID=2593676 RepID=UPI0022565AFD|nr:MULTISPECIES: hypothetical protein [unclassified Streptomyces]MCX5159996.1 hypothetical protein [Streptomyces sp. NBC_00305]MCX5218519.1 hypothetical protein [Streptomyces sp. NBC_00264]